MEFDNFKLAALGLSVLWIAAPLLALGGGRMGAAVSNAVVSAAIGASALPSLGARLIDRDEYVRLYGAAAQQQLPLALPVLCLGLAGLALSLAALGRGLTPLVIGWFTNTPLVAFVLYVAFWFQPY